MELDPDRNGPNHDPNLILGCVRTSRSKVGRNKFLCFTAVREKIRTKRDSDITGADLKQV